MLITHYFFFFFFNDTATTEIYTLSLHDALPIFLGLFDRPASKDCLEALRARPPIAGLTEPLVGLALKDWKLALNRLDRKSTRLNSSHDQISYAVFCLKKKK